MTYAAPAPTEPYLVLTPAGVLRAYAQREPDATCLQLQSLMDGAVAPRRSRRSFHADGPADAAGNSRTRDDGRRRAAQWFQST